MKARERVAILIIAHKSILTSNEVISLKQCAKVLCNYPIYLICPDNLNIDIYKKIAPEIQIDFIDKKWQRSYEAFNKLKQHPFLYERYSHYEYLLFYELDAFVFRDELEYWCSKEYDYIGAPWPEGFEKSTPESPLIGVGNGGFSLRKTASILKAINTFSIASSTKDAWNLSLIRRSKTSHRILYFIMTLLLNNTHYSLNSFHQQEDIYFGFYITRSCPWFRICPAEEAVRFSLEIQPRAIFKKYNEHTPFGCHAWTKYDNDFWLPIIHDHLF